MLELMPGKALDSEQGEADGDLVLETTPQAEEEWGMEDQPAPADVERSYIDSIKSMLSWTSCASRAADATGCITQTSTSSMGPLTSGRKKKILASIMGRLLETDNITPAALFENPTTRDFIEKNTDSWYHGGPRNPGHSCSFRRGGDGEVHVLQVDG